jgi:proteasome accessory factor A
VSVPKVTGVETEYGILVRGVGASDPVLASELLLAECEEAGPLLRPARGAVLSPFDLMLPNGARFYIDHAHPEYSTAEAIDPKDVVAADKAGEVLLDRCRARVLAQGRLPPGADLSLYKNNSDQKGNSYGCHENYLLAAPTFAAIMGAAPARGPGEVALAVLIPFLVTRAVLCGSGKVGAENGAPPAAFQITQRADFFETLVGLQTTHRRPLLNTRDEPHADLRRHRRLHVIVGDANLAEHPTYLKVGATQIILRLVEDGVALPDFTLEDPLAAARAVSRDLTFREALPLRTGGRVTALDVQRELAAVGRRHLAAVGADDPHHEVLELWQDGLDRLASDWRLVDRRFDWAIKRAVLERYLSRARTDWATMEAWRPIIEATLDVAVDTSADAAAILSAVRAHLGRAPSALLEEHARALGLSWADYRGRRETYFGLRRLDLEYHDIRSGEGASGVFRRLEAAGAVDRVIDDARVAAFVAGPPRDTRAYARGTCIGRYGASIRHVDWGEIAFAGPTDDETQVVALPDPTGPTEAEIGALLDARPDQPWAVLRMPRREGSS